MNNEIIRANMLAAEAWPEGTTANEKRLRILLARAHGITYGDDGELQNSAAVPWIDFKRDSPEDIEAKLLERLFRRMALQQSSERSVPE